jgi:serine/threonine protein kinase
MKRFKAVDFTLNPNMRKQIDQEVNILKQIEHENLVKFFKLLVVNLEEHSEQRFFILTEYYEVSNFNSFHFTLFTHKLTFFLEEILTEKLKL